MYRSFKECHFHLKTRLDYFFLQLIPSYRGYTIDSLRQLGVMDDIHISADEKHHFKGLARRRGRLN